MIALTMLQVPRTWNIVTTNNNRLSLKLGTAAGREVVMTEGNYSAKDLAKHLNTLFAADSIALTCTYDSISNRFTFTITSQGITGIIFYGMFSTCGRILGFDFTGGSDAEGESSITSALSVDLSGTRTVNVVTNLMTNNRDSFSRLNVGKTLARVPVNVAPLQLLSYVSPSPHYVYFMHPHIDVLQVELYDDENNLLDLHGTHWEANLKLNWFIRPPMHVPDPEQPLSLQHRGHQPASREAK